MEPANLSDDEIDNLAGNFFPDLPVDVQPPQQRLIQGVIFDLDFTLATPLPAAGRTHARRRRIRG